MERMDAGVHVGCAPSVKCALKTEPVSAPTACRSAPLKRAGPMDAGVSAVHVPPALPAPRLASASLRAYPIAPGKAAVKMDAGLMRKLLFEPELRGGVCVTNCTPQCQERVVDPTDVAEHAEDAAGLICKEDHVGKLHSQLCGEELWIGRMGGVCGVCPAGRFAHQWSLRNIWRERWRRGPRCSNLQSG